MNWRGWMRGSVGPSRTLLAVLLALVAALCVTLAIVQWWVSHAVFDEDRFAGIAVDVVEREEVRAELRREIVNQVVLRQPDLVAARPLLETVIDTALVSPAFRPIIERGARELHQILFDSDRRTIILNLSDIMTIAVSGVRAYDADLAERIPGGGGVATITVTDRNTATKLVELDRDLASIRWVLIVAAVVSLAAALLVSPTRYLVLLYAGLGLVGLAIVTWLAIGLVASFIRGNLDGNPAVAEVAVAVWDRYADGLVWWMWVQALTGVSLATIATSAIADVSIGQRAQRGFSFASGWWTNRAVRLTLAIALAALGICLVLAPLTTVRVIAQAAGLGLLYAGGYELVRALGIARVIRPAPAPSPPRRVPAAAPFRLTVPAVVAGFVLFSGAVASVAVFWLNRDSLSATPASAMPEIVECNGSSAACDLPVNDVAFAATHNSMAAAEEPGWYFANQSHGIAAQLDDGVRALLIDLYYGYATNSGVRTDPAIGNVSGRIEPTLGPAAAAAATNLINRIGPIPEGAAPSLYLCHGFCELGATSFDSMLVDLRQFLDGNPNEVVVLFLQDYVDPYDVEDAFVRSGAFDYVYTLVPGEPLPTLREMIEAGRRIIILSENVGAQDAPPWYHDAFAITQDTPYLFRSVDDLSCVPNRGPSDAPFFLINHWLTEGAPSPRTAERLNAADALTARIQECQETRGRTPTFLAVNFYERGDLFAVVDELNAR